MKVIGAILAGGRSRRFGSDKAVAVLDGATLIDRVIAALAPQVDALVVCGRTVDGHACVADRPGPGLGPLGGLAAALYYADAHGFDCVLSAPCDAPFLAGDLAARLGAAPSYAAGMPVVGLWGSGLSDMLDRHLATSDDRSMRGWAAVAGATPVDLGTMDNINTPGDLDQLASAVRSAASI